MIVWTVSCHRRTEKPHLSAVVAANVLGGVVCGREVRQRVHYRARRVTSIECPTSIMGCGDEVWHARKGGDAFFVEQCQKLVVLVWIGRCCAAAQNCGAG